MDEALIAQAQQAAGAVQRAELLRDEALEARRSLIISLHRAGLTTRQLAAVFDVTAPRISKIMDRNAEPRTARISKTRAPADI